MTFFDFMHILCGSCSVASLIALIVCMVSPHPVHWLEASMACIATLSTCAAVIMCIPSYKSKQNKDSAPQSASQLSRRGDASHDAYVVVVDEDVEHTLEPKVNTDQGVILG